MAKEKIEYKDWVFLVDNIATKNYYTGISEGWADDCGCEECKNYAINRASIFPLEIIKLFEEIGIDYTKEAEVVHVYELDNGEHQYNGWFHFVGSILKGPDAKVSKGKGYVLDTLQITENFEIGFTKEDVIILAFDKGTDLVRIEFNAYLPWTIEKSEKTYF